MHYGHGLKSAKVAGIGISPTVFKDVTRYLNKLTDRTYYTTGYIWDKKTKAPAYTPPVKNSTTAVAMTARVFMGAERSDPYLIRGAGLLSETLPSWNAEDKVKMDYYYWYYGTLAMFQVGGDYWTTWNDKLKNTLVNNQETQGCKTGSWPSEDYWSQKHKAGRIYATTLNILSLEIYYRYDKVFK